MRTIREVFDLSPVVPQPLGKYLVDSTCVGIEQELEGMPRHDSLPGWRTEPDGSLRNYGIEYVFDGPAGGLEAEMRIASFAEMAAKAKPIINERTATHVHIDFRDATMQDIGRFCAVYCVLEDTLFQLCDKSRIDNPFCVPFTSSSQMMNGLTMLLRSSQLPRSVLSESFRYGALNIASLPRYGTLEVRMRETILSESELLFWCNIFLAIKQFVRNWNDMSPANIVQTMSAAGVDTVMGTILTNDIWNEIKSRIPDADVRVFNSAQELQSSFTPWCGDVVRKPFYLEDNILVRHAIKNRRYREMLSYAKNMRVPELAEAICKAMGHSLPTHEQQVAWQLGDVPMFEISEAGAQLYNTSVTTRYPLSAGQRISRDALSRKECVLHRSTVIDRVGRVINIKELLTTESASLYESLINPIM